MLYYITLYYVLLCYIIVYSISYIILEIGGSRRRPVGTSEEPAASLPDLLAMPQESISSLSFLGERANKPALEPTGRTPQCL